MQIITTIYPELTDSTVVATNCVQCNKKMKVTLKASQTLNPFNKNKDGAVKTREDIYAELSDNINKQVKNFEHNCTCATCIKKEKSLPVYDLPLYVIYKSFYTISEPYVLYKINKINERSWSYEEYRRSTFNLKAGEYYWREEPKATQSIYKGVPRALEKGILFDNKEDAVKAFLDMMSIYKSALIVAEKGIAGKYGEFGVCEPVTK